MSPNSIFWESQVYKTHLCKCTDSYHALCQSIVTVTGPLLMLLREGSELSILYYRTVLKCTVWYILAHSNLCEGILSVKVSKSLLFHEPSSQFAKQIVICKTVVELLCGWSCHLTRKMMLKSSVLVLCCPSFLTYGQPYV